MEIKGAGKVIEGPKFLCLIDLRIYFYERS